jgi:hypothetical protein
LILIDSKRFIFSALLKNNMAHFINMRFFSALTLAMLIALYIIYGNYSQVKVNSDSRQHNSQLFEIQHTSQLFEIQHTSQLLEIQHTSQLFEIQAIVQANPCSNTNTDDIKTAARPCEYQQKIKYRVGIFLENSENFLTDHLSMSKSELHLARLYINTIKLSITNAFYIQFNGLIDGSAWPPAGQGI